MRRSIKKHILKLSNFHYILTAAIFIVTFFLGIGYAQISEIDLSVDGVASMSEQSGILYVNFNDGTDERLLDMSTLTATFDSPIVFGCSFDGSGNPQRPFTGTLKNMHVKVYE